MRNLLLWIGALVAGAVLGLLGVEWLNGLMDFVATVYTRLFQLLAVPTIALAIITTLTMFGRQQDTGRIFRKTLFYTLFTTVVAAAVGLLLYVVVAPENLSVPTAGTNVDSLGLKPEVSFYDHILAVIPGNVIKPFPRQCAQHSTGLHSHRNGAGTTAGNRGQTGGGKFPARTTGVALPADSLAYLDVALGYRGFLGPAFFPALGGCGLGFVG